METVRETVKAMVKAMVKAKISFSYIKTKATFGWLLFLFLYSFFKKHFPTFTAEKNGHTLRYIK